MITSTYASVTILQPGDHVANVGIVSRVEQRGVFVVALIQCYIWSTVDGMRHEQNREITWHSAETVALERWES